jgi:hypothetical protein
LTPLAARAQLIDASGRFTREGIVFLNELLALAGQSQQTSDQQTAQTFDDANARDWARSIQDAVFQSGTHFETRFRAELEELRQWLASLDTPRSGAGAEDASEVTYHSITYPTVQSALDKLLYVAPAFTSLTASVGPVEIGSTVASVVLHWALNKAVTSLTLNGAALSPTATTITETGPFTTNQWWAFAASDGTNTANASIGLAFEYSRYWGVSPNASLTNAQVLALASELSGARGKSITYNATGGNYPYYCYPAAWGLPSAVTVGGLAFSAYTVTTQSVTNASGYTASYYVIRFNSLQSGAAIATVWS